MEFKIKTDPSIKQETDELEIIGSTRSVPKPLIKCSKHLNEILEMICTQPDCPFNRTFCKQCNMEEIWNNNSQHFTTHKDYIKTIQQFFNENNLIIMKIKQKDGLKDEILKVSKLFEEIKKEIDDENLQNNKIPDFSSLNQTVFELDSKIDDAKYNLYGKILQKKIGKKKHKINKAGQQELIEILKKSKALIANYLNKFITKHRDIKFMEKLEKITEYFKLFEMKKIENKFIELNEDIQNIEENPESMISISQEDKLISIELKKLKTQIKKYKKEGWVKPLIFANKEEPKDMKAEN